MSPLNSAGAPAPKLGRIFRCLPLVVVLFAPIFSSAQDSISPDFDLQEIRGTYARFEGKPFLFNIADRRVSITLAPSTATVAPGETVQFSAAVTNTSKTEVGWSASAGSISASGLFTAPLQ